MAQQPSSATALRVSELPSNSKTDFSIRPDAADLKDIAQQLDLLGLRKVSFEGSVFAAGDEDWKLSGKLGATVVQPCAVTLEPVTTRIDVPVSRLYVRHFRESDAPESEMPEDDSVEALSAWINLSDVMIEALDLALPLYPRADGAELGAVQVSEPGVAPMTDDDAKPFAGLAQLKQQLQQSNDDEGETS